MSLKSQKLDGDVKETLKRFLLRSINLPDVADDEDLFETGMVNSLFAVQLTTFIEKTFRIEIEPDDLNIDNFRSLRAATDFVKAKFATSPV